MKFLLLFVTCFFISISVNAQDDMSITEQCESYGAFENSDGEMQDCEESEDQQYDEESEDSSETAEGEE